MNKKIPFVPTMSVYNAPADWSTVPDIDAVTIKATEGFTIEDRAFGQGWSQLGILKKPRMAFHFYRKYWPSAWQAKKFASTVAKYGWFKPGDKIALDCEEDGMSIGAIVDCMYNMELLTGIECVLYSRAELLNNLNPIKLTPAQLAWLKKRKVWTAGYPDNPDLYSVPPKSYVPDPNRYGPVVLWQWSEGFVVPGIDGSADPNWIDPDYFAQWVLETTGQPPVPPVPVPVPAEQIQKILVSVTSPADVSLLGVLVDDLDLTSKATIVVTHPIPPQPPVPVITNPGKLFYVRTNAEYNANCTPGKEHYPSVPATFSTVGQSQSLWGLLGDPEAKAIYRPDKNSLLVNWSQGPGKVYRTDLKYLAWPVTLGVSLNIPNYPREIVNVLKDLGKDSQGVEWVLIEAIRHKSNYDWLDTNIYLWLRQKLGMNFVGGKDVASVGNRNYTFTMLIFDPSTFDGPAHDANKEGMRIQKALLYGECPPEIQALYKSQPS